MKHKTLWIAVCALVVLCFAVYLIGLFNAVHMAFDDFGYFCLSYPFPTQEYSARDYALKDVFRYAVGTHYQNAQGRVSFLILALGINALFGLFALKMTFAGAVLSVCLWTTAQVKKKNGWMMAAAYVLPCIFWGLIGPYVQGNGSYWIVAAWYYLLPFPFFLMIYRLIEVNRPSAARCVTLYFISLLVGNALEQWFVILFSFSVLKLVHDRYSNHSIAADLSALAGCLTGGAILLGSPASWNRMASEETVGFVRRFIMAGANVVDSFFFTRNTWFLLAFFICQFVLAFLLLKQDRKWRGLDIVHLAGTIAVMGMLLRTRIVHGAWTTFAQDYGGVATASLFLYWFLCMIQTIRRYICEGYDVRRPMLTFAAYASIGCMALFPHLSGRAYLMFMMLSFVDMLDVFVSAFYRMKSRVLIGALVLSLAGMCAIGVRDMGRAYRNVSRNQVIFEENDRILYAAAAEGGDEIIHLYDYPFLEYTAFMNNNYEKMLMRYYYDIEVGRPIIHDLDYWELID